MSRGLSLEASLDGFGLQGDVVRYAGAVTSCGAGDRAAGELLGRVGEAAARLGVPSERFVAAVRRELARRLGGDEAARPLASALEVRAA